LYLESKILNFDSFLTHFWHNLAQKILCCQAKRRSRQYRLKETKQTRVLHSEIYKFEAKSSNQSSQNSEVI